MASPPQPDWSISGRGNRVAPQGAGLVPTCFGGVSAAFDVPAEVHRAFRSEIDMTSARCRYVARPRIARDLLAGGAKPRAVARRVGCAT